jgi:hypothetical protein
MTQTLYAHMNKIKIKKKRGLWFKASLSKNSSLDSILKKHKKRAGEVAQMVECLSSKCETLNLNPSTTKKKCTL